MNRWFGDRSDAACLRMPTIAESRATWYNDHTKRSQVVSLRRNLDCGYRDDIRRGVTIAGAISLVVCVAKTTGSDRHFGTLQNEKVSFTHYEICFPNMEELEPSPLTSIALIVMRRKARRRRIQA